MVIFTIGMVSALAMTCVGISDAARGNYTDCIVSYVFAAVTALAALASL
jgi:hypothetical protein